jgi:hypothetical protein
LVSTARGSARNGPFSKCGPWDAIRFFAFDRRWVFMAELLASPTTTRLNSSTRFAGTCRQRRGTNEHTEYTER